MDEVEVYKKTLFVDNFFEWMQKGGDIYGLSLWVDENADLHELRLEFDL